MRRFLVVFPLVLALVTAVLAAAPARAQENKFACAVFHFNLQYVAGGMEGFLPFGLQGLLPGWEMNNDEVEDMIVVESFEPVLDLYLRHPGWGVDLELQGRFIEILAERHPLVLAKLISLVERGQGSVVSFHYSDQLFIGYPRPAWERSVALTKEVFESAGVELSRTVFCQEGQAGTGMAQAMEEHGYEIMVWPKNLWKHQHGDWNPQPYYSFGNLSMVARAKGVNYNEGELQLTWTFLGDGELLATCGIDPYFPPVFKKNDRCIAEYEEKLEALEDDGWDVATVAEYVQGAKDLGIPPAEPPPLFDGTWQPGSTNGVFRWLGGAGIWRADERDNHVRTICAIAYRELMAAETIVEAAGMDAAAELRQAWRILSLAMVTDGTGINPYKGEVGYAIGHAAEAARLARVLIERAKGLLGEEEVGIDTAAGTVEPGTAPPEEFEEEATAPFDFRIITQRRHVQSRWFFVSEDPEIYRLDLTAEAGPGRPMVVVFPGDSREVTFTPALSDGDPVTYDLSIFEFGDWPMALPNGLISLGDDWCAIKDLGFTHVAAFINTTRDEVIFRDDTATPDSIFTWRFYVLRGTVDEAVAFAGALNVHPTLYR